MRPVPENLRSAGLSGEQRDFIGGGENISTGQVDQGSHVTLARITGAR